MAIKADDLIQPILKAIEPVLSKYWDDVQDYAKAEAEKMAKTLETIATLRLEKKIDDQQALALLEMQKQAMQAVLLTIEGLGLIVAQQAINAAIGAVRGTLNGAIGFALF